MEGELESNVIQFSASVFCMVKITVFFAISVVIFLLLISVQNVSGLIKITVFVAISVVIFLSKNPLRGLYLSFVIDP